MVNGVNGVSASRTAKSAGRKAVPLDMASVETKHIYKSEPPDRLFGLQNAPTYRPTHSEFADPLKYIEKIAPHAKKFGICKIIPPEDWNPPFAIDTELFNFRTRKQELNSMEAKCRASLNYIDQLFKFHTQNGTPMRGLPTLDGKPMNLYQLKESVERLGGYNIVNNPTRSDSAENRWHEVGKDFGFAENPTMCLSLAVNFKSAYQRYVLPYESFLFREKPKVQPNPVLDASPQQNDDAHDKPQVLEAEAKEDDASEVNSTAMASPSSNSSDKKRTKRLPQKDSDIETRASKRQKRASLLSPNPSPKKVSTMEVKPGENCETCGRGDDGVHMLLCDGCEAGYHIYCLDPPLSSVPKIDWYCSRCLVGTGEFGFEEGGVYSLSEFQQKANKWKKKYFQTQNAKVEGHDVTSVTEADVEREFWRLVQDVNETVEIEYGADVHSSTHGSAFPTLERQPQNIYSASPWNLNNMPLLDKSLLRFIKTDISGMTVPWLYVGMCFSTFCWHNEDHYTYSVNYQHFGETKTWYGIPGHNAIKFEDVLHRAVPELFEQQPDLLLQLVTIFSPERLVKEGVDVFGCDQHAGEFVITFPQAYHAGFNHGFNFNEAVNFALSDWMSEEFSKNCAERYRTFSRQPVFSHDELLLTAAHHDDSIETSIWLAPALEEMTTREIAERAAFVAANPHVQVVLAEEDVVEEGYMCGKCKVLTYLSQITCSCTSKVTCLQHSEDLCECDTSTRILRLRYPDEYLSQLVSHSQERACLPSAWREKFFATLKQGPAPHIKILRALLAEGDRIPYPIEELGTLRSFVAKVNEWIELATPLISKKGMNVGRRKSEKFKKSARAIQAEEEAQEKMKLQRHPDFLEKLVAEAKKLAFDSHEIQALEQKSEAIKQWKQDAADLMALDQISIDRCHDIIESGQALNVELPEVQSFVTYVTQLKWLEEARPSFDKVISLEDVVRMLDAGKACNVPLESLEMHKLEQRRRVGLHWEEQVSSFINSDKIPYDTIAKALELADGICVSSVSHSRLRQYLEKAQLVQKEVTTFNTRTTADHYDDRPTLQELAVLNEKLESLVAKPQGADSLSSYSKAVNDWIRRGKRIFGKTNAPLDIFGQHLDYVAQRNLACLSLDDTPRDPVEPASREATPEFSQDQVRNEPRNENFCMCRRPEAGMMLECDICHEWYHGKCLKVAKKDLKASNNNYVCPICDWREEIPRASNRPKLEEMQALEHDGRKLPLCTPEVKKLELITTVACRYKERVTPLMSSYLTLTSAELPTLRFYLRKLEGAEILLAKETNFFRAKIHELNPIAPHAPTPIDESKSTKRPRLSKKKREELEAQGIDPSTFFAKLKGNKIKGEPGPESRSRTASPAVEGLGSQSQSSTETGFKAARSPQPQSKKLSQSIFSSGANPYDNVTQFVATQPTFAASPQNAYNQNLSPRPQYSNVDSSQYQSSVSTPAFSTYLPDGYANAHHDYEATHISNNHMQDLDNSNNLFAHLHDQDLSANIMSTAMRTQEEPVDETPDDASYLLGFANQGAGDFANEGSEGNEAEEMMDSFLIS